MNRWVVPTGLLLVALLVRFAVDTDIGRDAASYLWMAERTLAGQPEALWNTVFHPGHPAAVALLGNGFPEVPPDQLGRLVACAAGALAVLPLWLLGRRVVGPTPAAWGALLYGVGGWFARTPGEAMSEGLYWLLLCWGLLLAGWGGIRRALAGGLLLGLAYAVQPHAAAVLMVLPVCRWCWRERHQALAVVVTAGSVVLLLVAGWGVWGPGATLTPKLAFNWREGAGGARDATTHLGEHLLGLPGALLEGIGFAALPLACLGLWCIGRPVATEGEPHGEPQDRGRRSTLLWLPFVVFLVPIVVLKAHHRFATSLGILLLPLAGLGLHAAIRWLLTALDPDRFLSGRKLAWGLVVLVVAGELVRLEVGGPSKPYERILGLALRQQLTPEPGRAPPPVTAPPSLVTDMPRVAGFAGVRPGPPRHRPEEEFLRAALRPETRWVVWMPRRTGELGAALQGAGFRFLPTARLLPPTARDTIADLEARGVRIYRR